MSLGCKSYFEQARVNAVPVLMSQCVLMSQFALLIQFVLLIQS